MAASIKISELNSLSNLTDVDLFLVSDMESGTSKKITYSTLKSNVTDDVSSALTSLENVVSQNRTDAETLVETVRAALQASIDTNASDFASGDSALDVRIDVLEADPTTKTEVENHVSALQNAISSIETTIGNLDIDIAPETLNSIDELAQALGDDPNFLSTLQSRLTAIESDNATQTELDALTATVNTHYTQMNAQDETLEGSIAALQDDVADEVTARTAAITALQADVDQNETDVNAAIAAIQADVDQNEADADAAIAALQTTINNLDIDLAPDTLNSINEIAAALGDDPSFLPALQNRLTVIENDNATQTELDAAVTSLTSGYITADQSLEGAIVALQDNVAVDVAALAAYKAEIEERNLQLMLAYDTPVYIDTLFGG